MSNRCPLCGGRAVGQVGVGQYYCWDCFVEFDAQNRVFEIAEDGSLVAWNSNLEEETATTV